MEKKSYGTGKRTKREIGKALMVINIKQEIIDILQITNRRFMYNPKIGSLILGDEVYGKNICSSHSQEFYVSKADGHFDDYCVGGLEYQKGIHVGLFILPLLSARNSSIEDLTRCRCLANLMA